jgi:hypothetical protein
MLTIPELLVPKSSVLYSCDLCHYNTSRCSQYDRHLLTAKHKKMEKKDKNVDILAKNVDNLLTDPQKSSKKTCPKKENMCASVVRNIITDKVYLYTKKRVYMNNRCHLEIHK